MLGTGAASPHHNVYIGLDVQVRMQLRYATIAVLLVLTACTSIGCMRRSPVADDSGVSPASLNAVVMANNKLAFGLYSDLSKNPSNILISPYSVLAALMLASEGQCGGSVLMPFSLPEEADLRRPSFAALHNSMNHRNGGVLRATNSLWLDRDYHLPNEYSRILTQHYAVMMESVDFRLRPDESRRKINKWIQKQTDDMILNPVSRDDVDSTTRILFVNTLFFRGEWSNQFERSERCKWNSICQG